jgi:hypothetical protein
MRIACVIKLTVVRVAQEFADHTPYLIRAIDGEGALTAVLTTFLASCKGSVSPTPIRSSTWPVKAPSASPLISPSKPCAHLQQTGDPTLDLGPSLSRFRDPA